MAIDKWRLFERTRARWPEAFLITPAAGDRCFESEPQLTRTYRDIESACDPGGEWTQDDEWVQLANWAFHQALWKLAEGAERATRIHRKDVTFGMFDECMRSNLSHPSWAEERSEYQESPTRFH